MRADMNPKMLMLTMPYRKTLHSSKLLNMRNTKLSFSVVSKFRRTRTAPPGPQEWCRLILLAEVFTRVGSELQYEPPHRFL